jgi:GTP-binding protein LepA
VTRERKLLEKQNARKKRVKHVGRIEVPQEAFLSVFADRRGELRRRTGLAVFAAL